MEFEQGDPEAAIDELFSRSRLRRLALVARLVLGKSVANSPPKRFAVPTMSRSLKVAQYHETLGSVPIGRTGELIVVSRHWNIASTFTGVHAVLKNYMHVWMSKFVLEVHCRDGLESESAKTEL